MAFENVFIFNCFYSHWHPITSRISIREVFLTACPTCCVKLHGVLDPKSKACCVHSVYLPPQYLVFYQHFHKRFMFVHLTCLFFFVCFFSAAIESLQTEVNRLRERLEGSLRTSSPANRATEPTSSLKDIRDRAPRHTSTPHPRQRDFRYLSFFCNLKPRALSLLGHHVTVTP